MEQHEMTDNPQDRQKPRRGTPPLDITGQKFGMLKAVRRTNERLHNVYLWICVCDCGRENVIAKVSDLTKGKKTHCGCMAISKNERLPEIGNMVSAERPLFSGKNFTSILEQDPNRNQTVAELLWHLMGVDKKTVAKEMGCSVSTLESLLRNEIESMKKEEKLRSELSRIMGGLSDTFLMSSIRGSRTVAILDAIMPKGTSFKIE